MAVFFAPAIRRSSRAVKKLYGFSAHGVLSKHTRIGSKAFGLWVSDFQLGRPALSTLVSTKN